MADTNDVVVAASAPDHSPLGAAERKAQVAKIYSRIQTWETRLIRIIPAQPSDPLVVDLETVVILSNNEMGLAKENCTLKYKALSYTWGAPVFDCQVQVNGMSFSITFNLHAALVSMRSKTEDVWLWADALSINQYDLEEKAHQIRNMFRIYQGAETVVVWLGQATPSTQAVIELLEVISNHQRVQPHLQQIKNKGGWQRGRKPPFGWALLERVGEVMRTMHSPLQLHALLEGCKHMLQSQWFSRAWVIQEVVAASAVSFHCGTYSTDWEAIRALPVITEALANMLCGSSETSAATRIPHLILPSFDSPSAATMDIIERARSDRWYLNSTEQSRKAVNAINQDKIPSRLVPGAIHLINLYLDIVRSDIQAAEPLDRFYCLFNIVDFPSTPAYARDELFVSIDYTAKPFDVLLQLCKISLLNPGGDYHDLLKVLDDQPVLQEITGSTGKVPTWLRYMEAVSMGVNYRKHRNIGLGKPPVLSVWAIPLGHVVVKGTAEDGSLWTAVRSFTPPFDMLTLQRDHRDSAWVMRPRSCNRSAGKCPTIKLAVDPFVLPEGPDRSDFNEDMQFALSPDALDEDLLVGFEYRLLVLRSRPDSTFEVIQWIHYTSVMWGEQLSGEKFATLPDMESVDYSDERWQVFSLV